VGIDAEAEAQKQRTEAQGQAEAIVSVQTAEATGIQKTLDAKSNGYRQLVSACGNNSREASTMLLVEKLEQNGSATANFMSNMVKSLPPLHEVAGMAGVDLPLYLGGVTKPETGA